MVVGTLYIENLILFCLKHLNGERTLYSIYHLLKGKKSSQTIQDAHLFQLTKFFGVYHLLTRELLEVTVKHSLERKWITSCGEQRYVLTKVGEENLQNLMTKFPFPTYINGWQYHQVDHRFWERLTLLIQVASNLVYGEKKYFPIQKNKEIVSWLKTFLKRNQLQKKELSSTLFSELVSCLESAKIVDPSVLVYRLTGYNKIGLTPQQTAEKLNMEYSHYHLEFINVLHYFIQQVSANVNRYPILASILESTMQNKILTNSTNKTFEMLNKGYSKEEIAKYRGLKMSTIEDHIVEIALNDNEFSIDTYIDQQLQQKILAVARQTDTKQLKLIRSRLETVDYFSIRLVLAKYGVAQWN